MAMNRFLKRYIQKHSDFEPFKGWRELGNAFPCGVPREKTSSKGPNISLSYKSLRAMAIVFIGKKHGGHPHKMLTLSCG